MRASFKHGGLGSHGVAEKHAEGCPALLVSVAEGGAKIEETRLFGFGVGDKVANAGTDAVGAHVGSEGGEAAFPVSHDDGGEAALRHGLSEVAVSVL